MNGFSRNLETACKVSLSLKINITIDRTRAAGWKCFKNYIPSNSVQKGPSFIEITLKTAMPWFPTGNMSESFQVSPGQAEEDI